jgi:hypothetical protein
MLLPEKGAGTPPVGNIVCRRDRPWWRRPNQPSNDVMPARAIAADLLTSKISEEIFRLIDRLGTNRP